MPIAGPLILAGGAIGSSLLNRGGGGSERRLQRQLLQQQAEQSRTLFRSGMPLLNSASAYYTRLLHGDRGAMTTALQPEITSITELYRGAGKNLDRNPAGPSRDLARAELNRQRVGQIGSLFPAARRGAAEGVANLGQIMLSGGQGATNVFSQLMSGLRADRQFGAAQNEKLGEALGPILVDLYKAWQTRGSTNAALPTV